MVLTFSMSLVSFLGSYSAIIILSDPDNIVIPDGDINYNINLTKSENMSLSIPYKFRNTGYFDLEDMQIGIKMYINFENMSEPDSNIKIKILDKNFEDWKLIEAEETEKGSIDVEPDDFTNLQELNDTANLYLDPANPHIWYTMDLKMSAYYSMRLLYFYVELKNLDVGAQDAY
ncbi:MAG: hypothetical protein ACTSR8_20300 [Promethearchaeota archaeon]